jgi:hypothetical protein
MAINTDFSISGNATATLGYDLDDEQLGFKNAFASNISLTLVPEDSASKTGDGSDWVGMIELNKFQILIDPEFDDDQFDEQLIEDGRNRYGALVVTEPEIVAKLVNGPLSLKFHSEPGNVAGKVDPVEDDKNDDDDYAAEDEDVDLHHDKSGAGVAFGYNTDDLGITLGITSDVAYDSDTKGGWHVSGDVKVDVGPATVEFQVVQGIQSKGDDGEKVGDASTGVAGKISGGDGDLTLSGALDVVLTGEPDIEATEDMNESLKWEVGAAAGFALTDSTSFDAEFIYSLDGMVASDIKAILSDNGGLVEGLSFSLTWGMFDFVNGSEAIDAADTMNNKVDMLLKADLSYGLSALGGTLTPGVDITVNRIDDADATVDVEVELVLTEAIPMAELGLKWVTDSLLGAGKDGVNDKGTVMAWTKVSY